MAYHCARAHSLALSKSTLCYTCGRDEPVLIMVDPDAAEEIGIGLRRVDATQRGERPAVARLADGFGRLGADVLRPANGIGEGPYRLAELTLEHLAAVADLACHLRRISQIG